MTKYTALAFLRRIDDINMTDTRGGENREPKCFVDLHQRQVDKNAMELANKVKTFFWGPIVHLIDFLFSLGRRLSLTTWRSQTSSLM